MYRLENPIDYEALPDNPDQRYVRPSVWILNNLMFQRQTQLHLTAELPLEGANIIALTHETQVDPFAVATTVLTQPELEHIKSSEPRITAKKEIFDWPISKIPILGHVAISLGAVPIDRENPDSEAYLARARDFFDTGQAMVIFPEGGTHAADGKVKKVKTGAARLAIVAADATGQAANLLPGSITYMRNRHLGKNRRKLHRPVLVLGKPLRVDSQSSVTEVTSELKLQMQSALDLGLELSRAS